MSDGTLIFDTKIDTSGMNTGTAKLKNQLQKGISDVNKQTSAVKSLEAEYQRWADTINDVKMAGGSVTPELQAGFDGVSAKLETAKIKLDGMKIKVEEAGEAYKKAMTPAAGAVDKTSAAVNRLSKRLSNTLKSALVFSVLYKALSGFKTYMSAALQTNQEFTSALAQMKGALLTAFQPIFSVIVPALTVLLQVLTSVISAIAKFFAILSGKGLSATKKSAEAMYDESNAISGAGGAADEAALSMADFDEINQLADNSGGGGGGGGGGTSAADFTGIDEAADKFRIIRDLVAAIALGLASWKIASIFTKDLGKIWGIAMSVAGAFLLVKGYIDAWKNGIDWPNLTEMIAGVALVAGGLALAFGHVAAGVALLVGGVALLVVGIKDWIATGELSTQTFVALEAGILAIGIALSLLTGNWIPLIIAAVAAVALAIYKYWDEIVAALKSVWDAIKQVWGEVCGWFKDNVIQPLWNIIEPFITWVGNVFSACWLIIQAVWKVVSEWFNNNVIQPLVKFFSPIVETVGGFFSKLWADIKIIWETVANWFKTYVTEPISKAWEACISGLKSFAKGIFNGIIGFFEGVINGIIAALNLFLSGLQAAATVAGAIVGKDWSTSLTIQPVSIPRLAQGAVIPANREFLAVLGDQKSGTNIETPLSTMVDAFNTALAQNGGGRGDITVIMELDGVQFGRAVYSANNSETQRVGLRLAGVNA